MELNSSNLSIPVISNTTTTSLAVKNKATTLVERTQSLLQQPPSPRLQQLEGRLRQLQTEESFTIQREENGNYLVLCRNTPLPSDHDFHALCLEAQYCKNRLEQLQKTYPNENFKLEFKKQLGYVDYFQDRLLNRKERYYWIVYDGLYFSPNDDFGYLIKTRHLRNDKLQELQALYPEENLQAMYDNETGGYCIKFAKTNYSYNSLENVLQEYYALKNKIAELNKKYPTVKFTFSFHQLSMINGHSRAVYLSIQLDGRVIHPDCNLELLLKNREQGEKKILQLYERYPDRTFVLSLQGERYYISLEEAPHLALPLDFDIEQFVHQRKEQERRLHELQSQYPDEKFKADFATTFHCIVFDGMRFRPEDKIESFVIERKERNEQLDRLKKNYPNIKLNDYYDRYDRDNQFYKIEFDGKYFTTQQAEIALQQYSNRSQNIIQLREKYPNERFDLVFSKNEENNFYQISFDGKSIVNSEEVETQLEQRNKRDQLYQHLKSVYPEINFQIGCERTEKSTGQYYIEYNNMHLPLNYDFDRLFTKRRAWIQVRDELRTHYPNQHFTLYLDDYGTFYAEFNRKFYYEPKKLYEAVSGQIS